MEKSKIEDTIIDIFKRIFPSILNVNPDTSSKEHKDWDSLKHIVLLTEIEREFAVKFDFDDILVMQDLQTIIDKVAERKV